MAFVADEREHGVVGRYPKTGLWHRLKPFDSWRYAGGTSVDRIGHMRRYNARYYIIGPQHDVDWSLSNLVMGPILTLNG